VRFEVKTNGTQAPQTIALKLAQAYNLHSEDRAGGSVQQGLSIATNTALVMLAWPARQINAKLFVFINPITPPILSFAPCLT
jgi:hypothetical protein